MVESQWTPLPLSPALAFSRLLSVYPRLAPCLHAVCQVGGLGRVSSPRSQRPIWTHQPKGQVAGSGSGRPSAARKPSEGLSPALAEPHREHYQTPFQLITKGTYAFHGLQLLVHNFLSNAVIRLKIPLEPWLHLEALNAASAGQGAAGTAPASGTACRPLP